MTPLCPPALPQLALGLGERLASGAALGGDWVDLPGWWPAWAAQDDVLCSLVLAGVAALGLVVPTARSAWRAQAAQWRRYRVAQGRRVRAG